MTTATMDKSIDFLTPNGFSRPASFDVIWDNILSKNYTQSRSFSSDITNALNFLRKKGVEIEDDISVEDFLTNNYGMLAYLYDVPKKVFDYFGDVPLKFSLFSDPDGQDNFQQVFFEIQTNLSPEKANEKLSQLNRNWLLKIEDKDIYSLNFSLNFA